MNLALIENELIESISDVIVREMKGRIFPSNTRSFLPNLSQDTFYSETLGLGQVFKQGPIVEGIKEGNARSGNRGHSGRPGQVGGSGGGGKEALSGKVFDNEGGYNWHEQGPARDWALDLSKDDNLAISNYSGFGYSDINNVLRGQTLMKTETRQATPEELQRLRGNDWKEIALPDGSILSSASMFGEVRSRVVDKERMERTSADAHSINDIISKRGIKLTEPIEVTRAGYIPGLSMEQLKTSIGKEHEEKGFTSTFLGPASGRADGDGYVSYGVAESKYKRFSMDINHEEIGTAIKFEIVLPKGTHVVSVEAARRTNYKHGDGTYDLDNKEQRSESEVLIGSGARFKVLSVSEQKPIRVSNESKVDVPYAKVRMEYVGGGSSR